MTIGTKSVLYGAHAFWLHPWFVALGYWKLYGFPWDPRLWVCFFVHDLGYIGKSNMDGPEGELHPILGGKIVRYLFGNEWGDFCILHSRFYARRLNRRYSRLCVCDKMAIVLTPSWLYIPLVWLTGELTEYMQMDRESKYKDSGFDHSTPWAWHKSVKAYIYSWVQEHREVDRPDSWLSGNASDVTNIQTVTLPGYLEGGYKHDKYIILKRDGSPVNPNAKYMVMRYDRDRDPHGIFATLAYAVSVVQDNEELGLQIIDALAYELKMNVGEFYDKYMDQIQFLKEVSKQYREKLSEN